MSEVIFNPNTGLDKCKRCKSPTESNIRNLFGDKAWMEIAFAESRNNDEDFEFSTSFLLKATNNAPESCLNVTDLSFTACYNALSAALTNGNINSFRYFITKKYCKKKTTK